MSEIKKIAKNTAALFTSAFLSRILSLILMIYIARKLGPVEFGKFAFAHSFPALFIILADMGLGLLIIREIARDKNLAPEYLGNTLILKFFLSIITFLSVFFAVKIIAKPPDVVFAAYMLTLFFILISFSTAFWGLYRAFEKMEYVPLMEITSRLILLGLTFFFLEKGYKLRTLVSLYLVSAIITFLLSMAIGFKKFTLPKFKIDFKKWVTLLKKAWPFAASAIFINILLNVDKVMLSIMENNQIVGWYTTSSNLFNNSIIFASAFLGALYPVMSKFFETSIKDLKNTYRKSFIYMMLLGVAISIGGVVLADKIILFLYGSQYFPSILAFRILFLGVLFAYLGSVCGCLTNSINKQLLGAKLMFIGVLLNILLNLSLIPAFSYKGASFATLISQSFIFVLFFFNVGKPFHNFAFGKILLKSILAVLVMALLLSLLKFLNLFILIVLGAITYSIGLFILKAITKEDVILFKELFRRT